MPSIHFFKFLGAVSYPLYRFAHPMFFWLYAVYKSKTDKFKLALLKQYVKPGHIVMDIGAHVGFYSLALANLVGESGNVIAFEPDKINFQFLRKNTKQYSQISINQKAVGASSGTLKLFRSRVLNVDHRMYDADGGTRNSVDVPVIAVDEHARQTGIKPSFIKMDIQGYEFEALKGMKGLLETNRPVILTELWPWGLKAARSSVEKLVEFLNILKYSLYLVDEETGLLKDFSESKLAQSESDYYDLLCLPK